MPQAKVYYTICDGFNLCELLNTPRFHFKPQVFAQPPGTEFMGKFVEDKK
jgi:hypothetical protein